MAKPKEQLSAAPLPDDGRRLYAIVSSPEQVHSVELVPGRDVVLGRGKDADVKVFDKGVAARHLSLRAVEDGLVRVEDLKDGGTLLNDVQVSGTAMARAGDQLSFGATEVILVMLSPRPEARPVRQKARPEFEERLADEVIRGRRFGRPFAWVVLRSPALRRAPRQSLLQALAAQVDPSAVWGDLGPDSVELLLPETDARESVAVAGRLAAALSGGGYRFQLGRASFPSDGRTVEELMDRALGGLMPPEAAPEDLLFLDPSMVRLRSLCEALAGRTFPVLFSGEAGTGKSVLARLVHELGLRRAGPFLPVDCAGVPDDVAVALFGQPEVKGASPGGAVAAASQGTLFLRQVHALPLGLQAKVVALLGPEGAQRGVRVLASTDEDLPKLAKAGLFREDLSALLSAAKVLVPALRDRPSEVMPLAESFLARCRKGHGRARLSLGVETQNLVQQYRWPGNVRELKVAIERVSLSSDLDSALPENLPAAVTRSSADRGGSGSGRTDLRSSLREAEKDALLKALAKTRWNVTAAAKHLGLPRRTVVYRMARLGVRRPAR